MNTALVIVFPRGQLAPKEKERLTRHGIIAVEADDPARVCVISPELAGIASNDLLRSALCALASQDAKDTLGRINSAGLAQEVFVKALAKSVSKSEKQP